MCGKHIRSEIIVSPGGWRIVGYQLNEHGHGLLSVSDRVYTRAEQIVVSKLFKVWPASYPSLVNMAAMSCL